MDNIVIGEQLIKEAKEFMEKDMQNTTNRLKSIRDESDYIQEALDDVNIRCLGGFLNKNSLNITFSCDEGLIFLSYEEDGNVKSQLSLRDISGPFESGTDLEEGVVEIKPTDEQTTISVVAVRLLELMKLGVDIQMLETVFETRFIDIRK